MANVPGNPSMGFQEFGRVEGASPTAGMTPGWIASSDASLIFRGDPIVTSSAGGANLSGNYITSATSGISFLRGIFQGCEQFIPTVGRVVWSNNYGGSLSGSTADIKCWFIENPDSLFLVQASSGAAITSSQIGLNVGFLPSSAAVGNATVGYSNVTLLSSTTANTSTLPFRLVDFYSNYAPPAIATIGSAAFINGTDNTTPSNMLMVRLNNCDRLQLQSRTA